MYSRQFGYYVLRLWLLFQSFVLADTFWYYNTERKGWGNLPNHRRGGYSSSLLSLLWVCWGKSCRVPHKTSAYTTLAGDGTSLLFLTWSELTPPCLCWGAAEVVSYIQAGMKVLHPHWAFYDHSEGRKGMPYYSGTG